MNHSLAMETNSLEETMERWFCELEYKGLMSQNPSEEIGVSESLDRITSKPVTAVHSYPHFYSASVDGIAVLSSKTYGANRMNPFVFQLGENAQFVGTGTPIPAGFDAVVPREDIRFYSIEEVEITNTYAPWENVRPLGEEVEATEVILPANHRIRPLDIAALLTGGLSWVSVIRKPQVGILALGASMAGPDFTLELEKSLETSSQILSNMARQWGAEPVLFGTVPEEPAKVCKKIKEFASKVDLFCVISGPSLGTRLLAEIIHNEGELLAYGIQIKPGMSACFGIKEDCPIIGLPGYAMSAFLIFDLFAGPVIHRKLGIQVRGRKRVKAYLSRNVHSPEGVVEFIRTSLGIVDNMPVANPISRGANILMSLVRADGLIRVEPDKTEMKVGEAIQVELLRPYIDIHKKIMIAGTHDICFGILRNELQKDFRDLTLYLSNVGSMRGLMALKAGYCHIASIHLFDSEKGEYNIPIVEKFLSDLPLIIVNFLHRSLGFLVAKGNPKNIAAFQDLARDDVKIINRIRGSGTRLLLDHYLKDNNIEVNEINGYADEAHTHLTLANAVASGYADAGLGILAAAKASNLDFVPMISERLDLVIPKKFLYSFHIKSILAVLVSESFKKKVESLGGYDSSATGMILFEN